MAKDYNGTPVPENQNPDSGNEEQQDNIPDWMKEAGWETSSGTFDESKPVFDDLDDDGDEILPADIPDWLEEVAPEGFTADPNATPAFEGLDVDEPFITTGDLVPPPSMETPAEEPEPEAAEQTSPTEPETAEKTSTSKPEEEFDIPTWLDNLELDEDSQETAVAWLENMPESLRATEEELQAAQDFPTEEPEVIEERVDDLAWVDDMDFGSDPTAPEAVDDDEAALSEDLVASDLLPETGEPDQLFEQQEIESLESDLPAWLQELGEDQPQAPASEVPQATPAGKETETSSPAEDESMPDWLQVTEGADPADTVPTAVSEPAAPASEEDAEIPEWLSGFEDSTPDDTGADDSLEWLDTLGRDAPSPEPAPEAASEDRSPEMPPQTPASAETQLEEETHPEPVPAAEDLPAPDQVAPDDETLNTQVPDWLAQIGDTGDLAEQVAEEEAEPEEEMPDLEAAAAPEDSEPQVSAEDFEMSDSWLDQISEAPGEAAESEEPAPESEVMGWLDEMDTAADAAETEDAPAVEDSQPDVRDQDAAPVELDTAQYLPEEDPSDELPDWLSELREDEEEEDISLEDAIRQSEHDLNQAEVDFLSQAEQKQAEEAEWLSKLDQAEPEPEIEPLTPSDLLDEFEQAQDEPEAPPAQEPASETPVEETPSEAAASGGMLDRLKDTAEFKQGEEVPQWLTDIKEEEDPQETAVLWLQQFVNKGDTADIQDEIKRYTNELDPGDAVPRWMEDLKNEEDPQTTAMLWLEKLAAERETQAPKAPPPTAEEDSGWLADLEREAADGPPDEPQAEVKDFDDPDQAWLADLEIDEKLQTPEEELPDWSDSDEKEAETEPPWMKATSPLEGDFFTDELGDGEEKEVEVPEWLAGYAEGESPEDIQEEETEPEEEYTWLAASESPAGGRTPLDLNKAAISQLEGILGISHQVAKGIVSYREKNGPYRDFSDLKNVPEIVDEQTIEILKPEVFISELPDTGEQQAPPPAPPEETAPEPPQSEREPAQKPVKKTSKEPAKKESFEEMLVTARARINEKEIDQAMELYATLIKKKKFLDEIIADLQEAALDNPLEISIQKTLGDAFMKKDLLDEALEAYSKAEDLLA